MRRTLAGLWWKGDCHVFDCFVVAVEYVISWLGRVELKFSSGDVGGSGSWRKHGNAAGCQVRNGTYFYGRHKTL